MSIFQGATLDAVRNALLLRFKGGSSLQFPNLDGVSSQAQRNLLLNGDMTNWQRGSSAANVTVAASYRADRMVFRAGGSSAQFACSRSTTVPNSQFKYSAALVENGDAVNNTMNCWQRIEAAVIRPYIGATVNFSIWYFNSGVATSPALYVQYPASEDTFNADPVLESVYTSKDFGFQTTLGVWKQLSFTFVVPSSAGNGLMVGFQHSANYSGTPTVLTTGWQLVEGKAPPPYFQRAHPNPGAELAACQRYGVNVNQVRNNNAYFVDGYAASTTIFYGTLKLPVTMRVAPFGLVTSGNAADYRLHDGAASVTCSAVPIFNAGGTVGTDTVSVQATVASGLTQFRPYSLTAFGNQTASLFFEAEL